MQITKDELDHENIRFNFSRRTNPDVASLTREKNRKKSRQHLYTS